MGIEHTLERIANALERLTAVTEDNLDVYRTVVMYQAARNLKPGESLLVLPGSRLSGTAPAEIVQSQVAEAPAIPPAPLAPAEPEFDREAAIAQLKAKGVEVPKGTKNTTVAKLLAAHCGNSAPSTPSVPEAPAVPAAPEVDIFGAPAAPEVKPMTKEECRKALTDLCTKPAPTVEERQVVAGVFAKFSAKNFDEIPAGSYAEVIALVKQGLKK